MDTFYSALGVTPDDDTERIRQAYREQVKRHHPDVSDAADASERFTRLTTAKEVLTDADERARYDRLGHETYLRRSSNLAGWNATAGATTEPGTVSAAASEAANEQVDRRGPAARTATPDQQTRGGTTAYGTAASYYTPGQRVGTAQSTGVGAVLGSLSKLDTAVVLHALLLVSSIVVASVFLVAGAVGVISTFVGAVLGVSMVGITVFVSALLVAANV
ncbi:J domain-containing protein [Halomicroarcula sp. GCM10025709]|uniref:J domain-containing protein n=1 Tax=Haloarcula TaxID=2237 RepID=UPI0024C45794|nr:DnaJ domain-containing protein [Halomicroarcula sp. YJ-61-S]